MVIAGKARGNANQLANYLLNIGENENITILDVDGRADSDVASFKNLLHSMELNSELTLSKKSVYHAYINPNPNKKEDRAMTMDEWRKSADILGKELGLEEQRRVIVLHEKKGRIHGHVVYERYDHSRQAMIDYKHNYLAHDKAREQLEKEFKHERTPQKNINQQNHKKELTTLWSENHNGIDFIKKAKAKGYIISKGTDRPFRVVDSNGRSFDLARQLDKIKTSEIRERLHNIKLLEDKAAIQQANVIKQQKMIAIELTTKKINQKNMNDETIEEMLTVQYREHLKESFKENKTEFENKHANKNEVIQAETKEQERERILEEMRIAKERLKELEHGPSL